MLATTLLLASLAGAEEPVIFCSSAVGRAPDGGNLPGDPLTLASGGENMLSWGPSSFTDLAGEIASECERYLVLTLNGLGDCERHAGRGRDVFALPSEHRLGST